MSLIILNVDEVRRTLSASGGAFVTHDKEVDIVRFAINSGFADIVLDGQVALRVMYQRPGETEVRAQTLTYYDTDGLHNYYDWQLSQSDLAKNGSLMVALCILDISGGEVSEWHTTPCAVRVLSTIHTDDSDEGDDTITPTVKERVAVLETMIQRVASGAPIVVASTSAMTDTDQIYVLSTNGRWYYHNGSAWVAGGEYGGVADGSVTTDKLADGAVTTAKIADGVIPVIDGKLDEISTNAVQNNIITSAIKGVKTDLAGLDVADQIDDYTITLGSIHTDTGAEMAMNNRCRTNYISFDGFKLEIKPKTGYKITTRIYSSAQQSGYIGHGDFTEEAVELRDNEYYYRIVIGKTDDSVISISELPDDVITVTNYYHTDKTLTKSNKCADSAETGSRFEALDNDIKSISGDLPNLFWFSDNVSHTIHGITLVQNPDGTVTFNGTSTTTTTIVLMDSHVHPLEAGTYIFGRELVEYDSPEPPKKNPYFYVPGIGSLLINTPITFDTPVEVYLYIATKYTFNNTTYKYSIRKEGLSAVDQVARQRLPKKSIKILGIGNSYTRDSTRWLSRILMNAGYDEVTVGHAYIGSIMLSEQYASLDPSDQKYTAYTYYKFVNGADRKEIANKSLVEVIANEVWDVVVFQQQSDESGQYTSFVFDDFDINNFIDYVKTAIPNENLRIGIVLPWSHATGYVGAKFEEYYNNDPAVQFAAIKSVIPQVANHMSQCDFIVNVGDAIDFGRKNTYLSTLGIEMLRTDKNHLYYGIPSYMAGLVYAMTICGISETDLTWYPTSDDEGVSCITSSNLARLARICAKRATSVIQ